MTNNKNKQYDDYDPELAESYATDPNSEKSIATNPNTRIIGIISIIGIICIVGAMTLCWIGSHVDYKSNKNMMINRKLLTVDITVELSWTKKSGRTARYKITIKEAPDALKIEGLNREFPDNDPNMDAKSIYSPDSRKDTFGILIDDGKLELVQGYLRDLLLSQNLRLVSCTESTTRVTQTQNFRCGVDNRPTVHAEHYFETEIVDNIWMLGQNEPIPNSFDHQLKIDGDKDWTTLTSQDHSYLQEMKGLLNSKLKSCQFQKFPDRSRCHGIGTRCKFKYYQHIVCEPRK